MEKKPYTTPSITDHGSAVEKTKGVAGAAWEYWGGKHDIIFDEDADSKQD